MAEPDRLSAHAPSLPPISRPTSLEHSIFGQREGNANDTANDDIEVNSLERVSLDQHEQAESIPLRQRAPYENKTPQHEISNPHEPTRIAQPSQLHRPRRRPSSWIERIWLWELLACLLSIACLIAIVGVLIYEDGRRLDQWDLFIAPNAVVSFIATIAKSSFLLAITELISQSKYVYFQNGAHALSDLQLFDAASRGPMGSLEFLIHKHRHAFLASIAVVIVLLSLLVDPFVQLVFSFPSRAVVDIDHYGKFSTSNMYDPNNYVTNDLNTPSGPGAVGTPMQAAILQGLFDDPPGKAASCPSGHCTWSNLTSLAICSQCEDITASTKIRHVEPFAIIGEIQKRQYITPSGAELYADIHFLGAASGLTMTQWNSSSSSLTPTYDGDAALFVHFDAIQLPLPHFTHESTGDIPTHTVWHCDLHFCTKTYDSIKVTNGTTTTSNPIEHELYADLSSSGIRNITGPNGPEIVYDLRTSDNAIENGPRQDYIVNFADYSNIGAYLAQMFDSGWYNYGGSSRPYGYFDDLVTPDIGRQLAESKDLPTTISNIAESMSESIRLTGNNRTVHHGEVYVERTFIHVQWGWLALPIALTLSTLSLLIVAIIQTQRSNVPTWKSNGLALLFCRLEGRDGYDMRPTNGRELDVIASSTKARLVERDDFYVFLKDKEK